MPCDSCTEGFVVSVSLTAAPAFTAAETIFYNTDLSKVPFVESVKMQITLKYNDSI